MHGMDTDMGWRASPHEQPLQDMGMDMDMELDMDMYMDMDMDTWAMDNGYGQGPPLAPCMATP